MLQTLPKVKVYISGPDDDTPVKGGIPASANQQGYLEIDSLNIWQAYQLRQRLVSERGQASPRVTPSHL